MDTTCSTCGKPHPTAAHEEATREGKEAKEGYRKLTIDQARAVFYGSEDAENWFKLDESPEEKLSDLDLVSCYKAFLRDTDEMFTGKSRSYGEMFIQYEADDVHRELESRLSEQIKDLVNEYYGMDPFPYGIASMDMDPEEMLKHADDDVIKISGELSEGVPTDFGGSGRTVFQVDVKLDYASGEVDLAAYSGDEVVVARDRKSCGIKEMHRKGLEKFLKEKLLGTK